MNMPSSRPDAGRGFLWPLRVYYEDTDAGGIVFYANYAKFFERARTELLRVFGIEQSRLEQETGIVFVVRGTALDYRAPSRLDDLLTIESHIERLGRASVDFVQHAWCGERLIATGKIRIACVERAALKPAPIPPDVLEALRRGPGVAHAGMSTANA